MKERMILTKYTRYPFGRDRDHGSWSRTRPADPVDSGATAESRDETENRVTAERQENREGDQH